ncbi:DNA primase [Candidatus Saccharibacteria bacterium]|nr:DNA primase [Candidatus Saccharibacteria bacterium]
MEGLDFKGALEMLARKAGVDLEKYQSAGKAAGGVEKNRLYQALELAAKFYQSQLSAKSEAVEYIFRKRGFSKETALAFQLGYSPDNQRSLTDFLIKKGFSEKEIKLCGLAVTRNGTTDMFRGRIMIPLHDNMGKVIGFTARLLKDNDKAPKYINTPSTPLYDKSRHVFGLHLAKQAIRKSNYSVIVEGNMDVIMSHQAGQRQVVATAGTAITEQQVKILSRLSPEVRLAFDQDRAGLEAAERAIPIASKVGVNLSIITVPEGKDPDELIKKDPKLWADAIDKTDYALDWLIERYKERFDLSKPQGKKAFSDEIIKVVKDLEDPVEQDHYIKTIANLAGVNESALRQKLDKTTAQNLKVKPIKTPKTATPRNNQDQIKTIDKFLSVILMLPSTRSFIELVETPMLETEQQVELLEFLRNNPDFDGSSKNSKQLLEKSQTSHSSAIDDLSLSNGSSRTSGTEKGVAQKKIGKSAENFDRANTSGVGQVEELRGLGDYVKILALQFEELYASVDALELEYEAARLRAKIIEYFVSRQKTILADKLNSSDKSKHEKILANVRELDILLNKIKEN